RVECQLEGPADLEVGGVAGMDEASAAEITFLSNPKYEPKLKTTRAAAVIVGLEIDVHGRPALRSSNPYVAFAKALEVFAPPRRPPVGMHPTAVIGAGARIGRNPSIG